MESLMNERENGEDGCCLEGCHWNDIVGCEGEKYFLVNVSQSYTKRFFSNTSNRSFNMDLNQIHLKQSQNEAVVTVEVKGVISIL